MNCVAFDRLVRGTFLIDDETESQQLKNPRTFLLFAVLVAVAASSGAYFMPGDWYASSNKPIWTTPNWNFPIAWTGLYIMIAVAGWLAWKACGVRPAVTVWAVGLIASNLRCGRLARCHGTHALSRTLRCLQ
jgi:hypothetical protein